MTDVHQVLNIENSNDNDIDVVHPSFEFQKFKDAIDNLVLDVQKFSEVIDGVYELFVESGEEEGLDWKPSQRDIKKKNKNNKLSVDYFESVLKPNVADFYDLRQFLSQPENSSLLKKYRVIVSVLQPKVLTAIDAGHTMDNILGKLSEYIAQKINESSEALDYICGIHYMYYVCDLGKR